MEPKGNQYGAITEEEYLSLETNVKTIHDLNALWPPISDPRAQGADHLRNIKTAILGTFPNLTSCPMTDAQSNALLALVGDGSGPDQMQVIQKATGDFDYKPLQGGVQKASGQMWFNYKADDGTIKYAFSQLAGDYVTNALGDGKYIRSPENSDTDNRITYIGQNKTNKGIYLRIADGSSVQLQPSGSYVTWDQMNTDIAVATNFKFNANGYAQFFRQDSSGGIVDFFSNYRSTNNRVAGVTADGSYHTLAGGSIYLDEPNTPDNTQGHTVSSPTVNLTMSNRGGGAIASMRLEEVIGDTHHIAFHINGYGADATYWMDGRSGRITSSIGGGFAFQSELNSAVNDLAARVPSAGTISGGTYTKTPMNDGTGRSVLRQSFVVQVNDYSTVNFPISYPNAPVLNVYSSDASGGDSVISNYRWNTLNGSSFQIHNSWINGGSQGTQDGMYIHVVVEGIVS